MGSYEELITSKDIDAVYIPLPTGLRKEWVIRAAQAGKHILSEKPCALSVADLEEIIEVCRASKVQYLDGVMFMHSPRLARVREILDEGSSVGSVRRMMSSFSFLMDEKTAGTNIRSQGGFEPTGCLGDLGWYCIRFALWAMRWRLPYMVTGRIISQSTPSTDQPSTPAEFSGELFFEGGVSMGFYSSFVNVYQQWVHVSGKNGYLLVPDFVHPFNSYEPAFEVNWTKITVEASAGAPTPPPGANLSDTGHPTAQDTWMIRNFANQVQSGCLNDDWPMWALRTQQVVDACFKSANYGGGEVSLG